MEPPCKKCLVLIRCKMRVDTFYRLAPITRLTKECSLIKKYCEEQDHYPPIELQKIFYKEEDRRREFLNGNTM